MALSRAKDEIYMVGYLEYAKKSKLLHEVAKYCEVAFISDIHVP